MTTKDNSDENKNHQAPDLYKFLHARDLKRIVEDETLHVGSASYFRENFQKYENADPRIFDPHEGRCEKPQEKPFVHRGVEFSSNIIIEQITDFHLLSFSFGSFSELAAEFYTPISESIEPYDACVKFTKIDRLIEKILNTGMWVRSDGDNIPVAAFIKSLESGYVQYDEISGSFFDPTFRASPFLKDKFFTAQSEYRFVFHARSQQVTKAHNFIMHVPGLAEHICGIYRNGEMVAAE